MDRTMENTEFEQMRDKALEQLMKGQSLTGKDGVFAPLLQQFLESALDSEMSSLTKKNVKMIISAMAKGENILKQCLDQSRLALLRIEKAVLSLK